MSAPAVFLDRDGTLIEEIGYLNDLSRLKLFPYSIDAVRLLNRAGFRIVVVTNQAGIARGIVSESFVNQAHQQIDASMRAGGARIDAFYYCPHHPDGVVDGFDVACTCRKPSPGLWQRAAQDLDLDLSRSFTVGDRWLDVEAGQAAGTTTVLVRTGHGASEPSQDALSTQVVTDLAAAAAYILERGSEIM